MKYLTHSVVALVFVSLMGAPAAHAQVGTPSIASLQAQLAALQAQLAAFKGKGTVQAAMGDDSGVKITRVSTSKKPSVSGTAEETVKLYIVVTKDGSPKPVFRKSVKVTREKWQAKIAKNLKDGTYKVYVYASQKDDVVLASTSFTVGKESRSSKTKPDAKAAAQGSFSVSLVPLLMGGTTRAGESVPVSYLKVANTSKETQTLTSVTLTQKGSAQADAVARLTIKDDKDGSQGEVAVSGVTAVLPTTSVFAPGQMKLFTIRAVLAPGASSQVGRTLQYEVSDISGGKGAFPIRGTTYTIGL